MKNYDVKQVVLTVGTHLVQGYGPDTKITVERLNPMFSLTVGVDGETTRSKSNDKSARLTVRLQKSSDSCRFLSALARSDEQSNAGVVPLLLKDLIGGDVVSGADAFIEQVPSVPYGGEVGVLEWSILVPECEILLGGQG